MEAPPTIEETNKDDPAEVTPETIQKQPQDDGELFSRFVVIVLGMVLGAIAAFIIGLSTGWIPFEC